MNFYKKLCTPVINMWISFLYYETISCVEGRGRGALNAYFSD
jgi:hypothetical protein